MKKIVCLVVVILMIAAVAYAAKKVAITPKNLASVKGIYDGVLGFGEMQGMSSPITLEIVNDTVPVKAKWTLANVPDKVAAQFGETSGQKSNEADGGIITSQGTLFWTGPGGNFVEITLLDNKKISVWYFYKGMRGDAVLAKKK